MLCFVLIICIGCVLDLICVCYGDFLYWFWLVMGVVCDWLLVVDVVVGEVLFRVMEVVGVLIIGLVVMVIEWVGWSECIVGWICDVMDYVLFMFGVCYGY